MAHEKTPAPAFSALAMQQQQNEFARGRLAVEQLDGVQQQIGWQGYLLLRNTHTNSFRLYVAEKSVRHPTKLTQLRYVRYVVELDVAGQRVKVITKTSYKPPAVKLGKEWTLESAVRAYVAAIAKEKRHVPTLEKAADEPDDRQVAV